MYGADFLCYLTPAEHLGLPNEADVVEGVRTTRIAADCVNALHRRGAYEKSREVAKGRVNLDQKAQIENSLDPEYLTGRFAAENRRHPKDSEHQRTLMDVAADYYGIGEAVS